MKVCVQCQQEVEEIFRRDTCLRCTLLERYPNRERCVHCGVMPRCSKNVLCVFCNKNASVRGRHIKKIRTGCLLTWSAGPADYPTSHYPGTEEKVRVLEERASKRQCLWHPQDFNCLVTHGEDDD